MRHTYSDPRRWRWSVRSTRRGGRRRRRCCRIVGLALNKGSESTTSRAGQPWASEGEGKDEVETTHVDCWRGEMLLGQPL